MKEHVLETLPSKVSPEAMNTGAPVSLRTGSVNHGVTLFETFGDESAEQGKVNTIRQMAIDYGLTCEEFAKHCNHAIEMADASDKANGFQPSEGAKGLAKYGPKRKVMSTRLSEARILFGATKQDQNLTKEMGYWKAVAAARDYLDNKNIKWNGERKPTTQEKQASKDAAVQMSALQDVMKVNPMKPGESIKDYNERMAELVDKAIEDKRQEAANEVVATLLKKLEEKHSPEILLSLADAIFVKYELANEGEPSTDSEGENVNE